MVYWARVLPDANADSSGSLGPCVVVESDLRRGNCRTVAEFRRGMNPNWLLALDSDRSSLITQMHDDLNPGRPKPLARIDLTSGNVQLIKTDTNAFYPLDVSPRRECILFRLDRGQVAAYSFDGRRRAVARLKTSDPHASLHPADNIAVVSDDGIWLWNINNNRTRKLLDSGREAGWSPDGKEIWYCGKESELWMLEPDSGRTQRIAALSGDTEKSDGYAQPVVWSPTGRYLVAGLTRKARTSPQEEKRRRRLYKDMREDNYRFDHDHCLCVLDVKERRAWSHADYCHRIAWFAVPAERRWP